MADGNLRDRLVAKFGKTIFPVEKESRIEDCDWHFTTFSVSDEIYASENVFEKTYNARIGKTKLCKLLAGDLFRVLEKAGGYIDREEVNLIMGIQAVQEDLNAKAREFAARHPIRARFRELFLGR